MSLTLPKMDSILIREDVEGLIEAGAPADEYRDEAAQIVIAIEAMEANIINEDIILATISNIWMKNFELSRKDIEIRLPALERVARAISLLLK